MTQVFLACRDCGQIHRVAARLLADRRLLCRRCGRRLWRSPRGGLEHALAFTAAAIILLALASTSALFEISRTGDHRSGLIASGPVQLTQYGGAVAGVGVLVGLTSIIFPALTVGLIVAVLARLVFGRRDNAPSRPILAASWKFASRLRPWSMLDVDLLGAAVAYTRLNRLADVAIGAGGYALAALVFFQALIDQPLGRQHVWHAIGNPVMHAPTPGERWILCLDCELVVGASATVRRRCPRCGAHLVPRRPGSLATTTAFIASAVWNAVLEA